MDSQESASRDALEKVGFGEPASWLATKPLFSFSRTSFTKAQCVHRIGRFEFSDDQLEWVKVNLEHGGGINSIHEVFFVLRYKWPDQFEFFLESDLEMVIKWLSTDTQARKQGCEFGGMNDFMYGQRQDPEGGWHRVFGRQQYAFRFPKMTRLINTFNIELRETEVFVVRLLAEKFEPRVVEVILASKLYLNLSYEDIALGLTRSFSYLLRGYRYVWMLPFKKRHVEIVWYRSQLAQTESLRRIAGKDRQEENFSRFLMLFMKCVESGRADERLGLDPRSCGNGTSAANLVEEVMRLFLGKVASKDMFEALMAL